MRRHLPPLNNNRLLYKFEKEHLGNKKELLEKEDLNTDAEISHRVEQNVSTEKQEGKDKKIRRSF